MGGHWQEEEPWARLCLRLFFVGCFLEHYTCYGGIVAVFDTDFHIGIFFIFTFYNFLIYFFKKN